MKKNILLILLIGLCFSNVYAQKQALILGYSQIENVYEDENVKMELVRLDLLITNKTNTTVYIDKKSSFYYVNEDPICFYEGKETHYSNGETIIEKDILPVAPKSKYSLYYNAPVCGRYNAVKENKGAGFFGNLFKGNDGTSYVLGDAAVEYMGYIETLRYELANNQNKSASNLHLTGEDSFLKVSVSINYTMNPKMESFIPVTLVTWVSDMVMSKYYVQPQDKIVKSNSVNVQGRMYNILHVFANAPFEYEEDESPLDMYIVEFDKGSFKVSQFNNVEGDEKQAKKKDEITSNFAKKPKYKNIFVWEGESSNWIQAMTDSYEKFMLEDGAKPKEALKKAKDVAKDAKSQQTLKP